MRVIGGTCPGTPLRAKLPEGVRPTTDFAREAIFSMLESRGGLVGLVVADLYCGMRRDGHRGAVSRGAANVYFVDADPACLAAAEANLEPLRLEGAATYVRATLPAWRAPADLDLVLADPPYGEFDVAALLEASPAPRVVIENDRLCDAPSGWIVTKTKRYGTTLVTMVERDEGDAA